MKTREIIGYNVKSRREALSWTVEELSERIGMGWQTIDRIEKGFGTSLSTIDKLSKALNCSIQDLFCGIKEDDSTVGHINSIENWNLNK